VPPNSAGSERAKEFVRLAETLFWPTDGRKSQDGFFDGLIEAQLNRQQRKDAIVKTDGAAKKIKVDAPLKTRSRTRPDTVIQRVTHGEPDGIAFFCDSIKIDEPAKTRSRFRSDTTIQQVTKRELDEIAFLAISSKLMNP